MCVYLISMEVPLMTPDQPKYLNLLVSNEIFQPIPVWQSYDNKIWQLFTMGTRSEYCYEYILSKIDLSICLAQITDSAWASGCDSIR